MRALYCPSSSYFDEGVKQYAGWWRILEYQKEAIEGAGYEVICPQVPGEYLDKASSFSEIGSYSLYLSQFVDDTIDLVIGAPSFAHHSIFRASANPKIKKVVCLWNQADWFRQKQVAPEYKKFGIPFPTLPINTLMNELSLKLSDTVIANSHFTRKTHAEIVPESKIKVAMWGVDSERFHPGGREGFKVLFFGSNPVRKGFTYLWEALTSCRESLGDFEFWVLGCEPVSGELPPNMKVFGLVPNVQVPEIIRQCHVMVLPTLEDGMPLGVQECMASGVVPIATECAAEAFEHYRSGFVIPYRDPEAIARYLVVLRDNPVLLGCMSKEARRKAETQTWAKYKQQFADILKEV